ncbi:hypothetical protein [Phocaeicola sp.]
MNKRLNKMNNFTNIKYIIAILFSACIIASCTEEVLETEGGQSNEDPQTVTINFATPAAMSVSFSRAAGDAPDADYIVSDLYIYIFDAAESGNSELLTVNKDGIVSPIHYQGQELLDGTAGGQEMKENIEGGLYNSSWTRAKVKTEALGKDVYVYLIANANSYDDKLSLNNDDLMNITKQSELDDMIYEYTTTLTTARTSFLMSGCGPLGGNVGAYKYTIDLNGRLIDWSGDATIGLERAEAKITFNIKNGSNAKGVFTPTEYIIHNYPKYSFLYWKYYLQSGFSLGGQDMSTTVGKDASLEEDDFTKNTDAVSIPFNSETKQGSFTFHMPENLKWNGKDIFSKSDATAGLKEREKRNTDGSWKNAPEYATYVEIKGKYEGSSNLGEVIADVKYTIHLGFQRVNKGGNSYYVNSYFISRNMKYIYNLTINGIDDIALEVINGKDIMSAAEGDITVEETITLTTGSTLKVTDSNEQWAINSIGDNSWLKVNTQTIDEWVGTTHEKGNNYKLSADPLSDDASERSITLTATRKYEKNGKNSSITRIITIRQTNI